MNFYAFKGFDKDLKCRGFQYEVGKTYRIEDEPKLCEQGYHCCLKLSEVFSYYPPNTWVTSGVLDYLPVKKLPSGNRYCAVEVCGDIDTDGVSFSDSSKISTNSIKILQELTDEDVVDILEKEELEAKYRWDRINRITKDFIADVLQKRGVNRPWYMMPRFQ